MSFTVQVEVPNGSDCSVEPSALLGTLANQWNDATERMDRNAILGALAEQ